MAEKTQSQIRADAVAKIIANTNGKTAVQMNNEQIANGNVQKVSGGVYGYPSSNEVSSAESSRSETPILDSATGKKHSSVDYSGATVADAIKSTQNKVGLKDAVNDSKLLKSVSAGLKNLASNFSNNVATQYDAMGGSAVTDSYREQLDMAQREMDAIDAQIADNTTTESERKMLLITKSELEDKIKMYSDIVRANKDVGKSTYQLVDKLDESAAKDVQEATEGKGRVGQLVYGDVVPFATQIAVGNAINPALTNMYISGGKVAKDYRRSSGDKYNASNAQKMSLVTEAGILLANAASGATREAGEGVLSNIASKQQTYTGLQNKILPNLAVSLASDASYVATAIASRELAKAVFDDDYEINWQNIGTEALMQLAWSAVSNVIGLAKTSAQNKEYINNGLEQTKELYKNLQEAINNGTMSDYEINQLAQQIAYSASETYQFLGNNQFVGANKEVTSAMNFLNSVYNEMSRISNGLPSYSSSTPMLQSTNNPIATTVPTSSENRASTPMQIATNQTTRQNAMPIASARTETVKTTNIAPNSQSVVEGYKTQNNGINQTSTNTVKTYEEAIEDDGLIGFDVAQDFTSADVEKAIRTGTVTVYSDKPIEPGTTVTPSKMEAEYASKGGEIYSKDVNLNDVAWEDSAKGQYNGEVSQDNPNTVGSKEANYKAKIVESQTKSTDSEYSKKRAELLTTSLRDSGKTFAEVADEIGENIVTVAQLLDGSVVPTEEQTVKLANALGIDADEIRANIPTAETHQVYSNKQSVEEAKERLEYDYDFEEQDLPNRQDWTATERDMAQIILQDKYEEAKANGFKDMSEVAKWRKTIAEHMTTAGQVLQAGQKYVFTPATVVADSAAVLENAKIPEDKKAEVINAISRQAEKLDSIQDSDHDSLVEIVKENSRIRRTDGLFGKMSKSLTDLIDNDSSEHLRLVAEAQIRNMASDYVKPSLMDRVHSYRVMAMLSNVATIARNLTGNNVFDPVEVISNDVSIPLDLFLSKITGVRGVPLNKGWMSSAKRQGSLDGFKKSVIDVALDVDTNHAVVRYEGASSNRTFKMTGNVFERLLSTWSKYEGYTLNSTDEFQKGGIRSEVTRGANELIRQGKADDTILNNAESDALYTTFQDEDGLGALTNRIRGAVDDFTGKKFKVKAGSALIPFSKVPSNLIGRAFDYSVNPVSAAEATIEIVKFIKSAKDGNVTSEQQGKLCKRIGRMLNGSAMIAIFAVLASKGVLKVSDDENNKDKKALDSSNGVYGTQFNIDAFGRMMNGEDTTWQYGDTLVSVGFLQPINFMMATGALLNDSLQDGYDFGDVTRSTFSGALQSLMELPLMKNLQAFSNGYKYSKRETEGEKMLDASLSMIAEIPSSFVPNIIAASSRGADNNYRDEYSGDTFAQQVVDSFKSSTPARKTLPTVQDNFGNDKTYTDNTLLNLANAIALPGSINKYKKNATLQELDRVYKSTGVSVYLTRDPIESVTINKVKTELSDEQKTEYKSIRGDKASSMLEETMSSSKYRNASDEEKAKMIKSVNDYSSAYAKYKIFGADAVDSWIVDATESKERYGISTSDYLLSKEKYGSMLYGEGGDKTSAMLDAGLTLDEWYTMKNSVDADGNDGVTKSEVCNYLDDVYGNDRSTKRNVFEAYKGNRTWKNPY